ncbi:MAG TPA: bifunctional phosphopantothenoylcysteine decarboxylase/phosphopantothenate--cysteine ligase CoaBC [Chloroflexota bacterium]|nr:bifunctional phosphopantothenoylcysteine decarboxylase/phosphopantothenate--cysteine ligase CoaBC [Chloroflexota bacterium]
MAGVGGKRIVLGVTGSIAAFKAAQLCSTLVQAGAEVDVILTDAAQKFVTPLTFQSLTHRPVFADLFDTLPDLSIAHVALGARADALVICPASATTLARLARGSAEDMLSSTALASKAPLVIAPAMNVNMWEHPATQENVAILRRRGAIQVGPVVGHLAEGMSAMGRLAPLEDIQAALSMAMGRREPWLGRHVVVTAAGTQEPIDPVRYVGNRSSGKMGYAVATAARDRGARVTLIAGPTALPTPWGVERRPVATTREMQQAVLDACREAAVLIMAAAVADYRPEVVAEHKIKKQAQQELTLHLTENPDILVSVHQRYGDGLIKVGFAAESRDVLAEAARKLVAKGLHLICANDVTEAGSGFGTDTNRVTILGRDGRREDLPLLPKEDVAERLLDEVEALLK